MELFGQALPFLAVPLLGGDECGPGIRLHQAFLPDVAPGVTHAGALSREVGGDGRSRPRLGAQRLGVCQEQGAAIAVDVCVGGELDGSVAAARLEADRQAGAQPYVQARQPVPPGEGFRGFRLVAYEEVLQGDHSAAEVLGEGGIGGPALAGQALRGQVPCGQVPGAGGARDLGVRHLQGRDVQQPEEGGELEDVSSRLPQRKAISQGPFDRGVGHREHLPPLVLLTQPAVVHSGRPRSLLRNPGSTGR